jgi:hypothetical protein
MGDPDMDWQYEEALKMLGLVKKEEEEEEDQGGKEALKLMLRLQWKGGRLW